MIVLDTHIWVWWVHGDPKQSAAQKEVLEEHEESGLLVSAISCWEVAKLVEYGRLQLPGPVLEWMEQALAYPGVRVVELTPKIVVESTQLPGDFHSDPADQLIVATARVLGHPLVTSDRKILDYPHVQLLPRA
jgi:PIN domain nuclease of toxin-antitoxin system